MLSRIPKNAQANQWRESDVAKMRPAEYERNEDQLQKQFAPATSFTIFLAVHVNLHFTNRQKCGTKYIRI